MYSQVLEMNAKRNIKIKYTIAEIDTNPIKSFNHKLRETKAAQNGKKAMIKHYCQS